MKEGNKYKKLVKNSGLFFIGSIGSKFITFFLVPLYTNTLTTAEYGVTDIVSTSVILCIPIFSLSLDDAIMRFGLMKNVNIPNLAKNMFMVLVGSFFAILFAFPVFDRIGLFGEWTPFFCVILFLHIVRNASSIFLKSVDRVSVFTIDSIFYAFVLGLLNLFYLKILGWRVKGYFLALITSMILSISFQMVKGHVIKDIVEGSFDIELLSAMLKYSAPLIFSAISWWVINSSDRYMLKYFMDYDAVGIYGISAKIPNLIGAFTSVFSAAWLISSITEYEGDKDSQFYGRIFKFYVAFLGLSASGILMILKPFMSIYVGKDFFVAWQYVPFLLIGIVCGTLVNYFTPIYKAELKNMQEIKLVMTGALSNIIINALLIPRIGIQGASIGTLSAELIMLIMCIIGTRKIYKFDINTVPFLLTLSILFIQSVALIADFKFSIIISILSFILIIILHKNTYISILNYVLIKLKG